MKQKHLSGWMKAVLVVMGVIGGVIYLLAVPTCGRVMQQMYPEYAHCFWPWLIFLWASGIPCYAVLCFAWQIAGSIGRDQAFTVKNAVRLRRIAALAAADAAFFFAGNIVLLFLGMSHPGIMLYAFAVEFLGIAVAVATEALSHLVKKAAALQEQSDWTI